MTCDKKNQGRRHLDLVSVVFSSEDGCGYARDFCANCWAEHNGGSCSFRSSGAEQVQRRKRRGVQSPPFRGLLDRTSDAPKVQKGHKNQKERRKEALLVSGGALDTEGLAEDVQNVFRYKEGGTVEVAKV